MNYFQKKVAQWDKHQTVFQQLWNDRCICVLIHVQLTVTGIDNGVWEAAVQFYAQKKTIRCGIWHKLPPLDLQITAVAVPF